MKGEKNEIHKSNRVTFRRITQTKKFTQTQLAAKRKISRMTINGIIKSRANIVTFESLLLICDALNITIKEFFNSYIFEEAFEPPQKAKGRRIQ